jgi:O-antigen ligase
MTMPTDSAAVRWVGPGPAVAIPLATGFAWLGLSFAHYQNQTAAMLPFALAGAAGCLLVVAAAVLGKRWAISALIVFVIFGLSLSLRTRQIGETGLDFQNGMKLATWMLLPVIGVFHWQRLLPFLKEPTVILAALYGLFAMASSLWSLTPAYTAGNALGFVAYLVLACLAVSILGMPSIMRLITITLLLYVLVALAYGVIAPDAAWIAPSNVETAYRLQGLSGHPNVLGEQTAILIAFAAVAYRSKVIGLKMMLLCTIVGFVALIETDSRTTMAAAIAAWLIIALRDRQLLLPGAVIAFCCAVLTFGVLAIDGMPNIVHLLGGLSRTGSTNEILTLTGRTDLWAVAADLIAQKPFFGWGFNGTEALMMGSVGRAFIGDPVNAHNMYIQTLLSVGFLGSLPAYLLLGTLVWRMFTRPDSTRDQIVLLAMIIGLAEVGLFSTPVLLPLVFFMVIANQVTLPKEPAAPPEPAPSLMEPLAS